MKASKLAIRVSSATVFLGALCLAACAAAVGQNSPADAPDGSHAQSVLALQPRHATLSVADLQVERNWYIEKLGFTLKPMPSMGGPNGKMKGVQLTTPAYQIHLIQYEGSERAKTPSPVYLAQGWVHIAFTVADLEKALSFLQTAGTDVKGNRNKEGQLGTLVLHDPEGNEIELFSRS